MRRFIAVLGLLVFSTQSALADEREPSADAGGLLGLTVSSSTLREAREILVALPNDYDTSGARYPVLYVLDAEWHFRSVVNTVRRLTEGSQNGSSSIPRLIVVGIVNTDRDRDHTPTRCVRQLGESFPTSGGADSFLTFVADELIPYVDGHYRTQSYDILAGWSLGGLLTMHALFTRPNIFDAHIAISPSLWWEDEVELTRTAVLPEDDNAPDRKLVLTIGSAEKGGPCYDAVEHLLDQWKTAPIQRLKVTFVEIAGADHDASQFKGYTEGLIALFGE